MQAEGSIHGGFLSLRLLPHHQGKSRNDPIHSSIGKASRTLCCASGPIAEGEVCAVACLAWVGGLEIGR